jgi:predicted dehydrogenase
MELSRRNFVTTSAGVALSATAFSKGSGLFLDRPTIKVGLIGCGGRGNGAIRDSLAAEPGVVVHAVADIFADRAKGTATALQNEYKQRCQIGERVFTGYSAYMDVLDSGCDVVILTTAPGFRPMHFSAAVKAGKHVFMEKPVAVDGPGIRQVMEAAKIAKEKNLIVVAGTQRRADNAYMDCIKRIQDGAIGDVSHMLCYWNQGGLWINDRNPDWTDAEYQIRNWLYYTWLSGDHIVEQHVHNLDVCNWVMNGHPVKATAMGGRQARTDAVYGHIFDHFAVEYEYANGVKLGSYCRQIDGCTNRVAEQIIGTKGQSNANTQIKGEAAWRFSGERPNPYVQEHVRLYKNIAESTGFNEAVQVAESTLTAIMGRMSAYSGTEVTWDQALNSKVRLMPDELAGKVAVPPVAIPGKFKGAF